jgi:hypothetical protein
MIQLASAATIKGDFAQTSLTLRGEPYLLRVRGGVYYVTESYLTGNPSNTAWTTPSAAAASSTI